MFHISTHISPAIEPEVHPRAETPHANDDGTPHTSSPASVTPGAGFPSPGASGKPSGLLGSLPPPSSGFAPIKLPGDSTTYYIKNSSGNGPRTLYTSDPQAGTYKQTNKTVVSDGHDGWQLDDGLKAGGRTQEMEAIKADINTVKNDKKTLSESMRHLERGISQSQGVIDYNQREVDRLRATTTDQYNHISNNFGAILSPRGEVNYAVYDNLSPNQKAEFNPLRSRYSYDIRGLANSEGVVRSHRDGIPKLQGNLDRDRSRLTELEGREQTLTRKYEELKRQSDNDSKKDDEPMSKKPKLS